KHSDYHEEDIAVGEHRAERRIKRPTRIDPSGQQRRDGEQTSPNVQIPTGEVQAGEGDVARPDHERQQKIAQRGRDGRNQEEPDHHHTVKGERLVVGLRAHDRPLGLHEIEADERGRHASQEEEESDTERIEDRNPLVVARGEPIEEPVVPGEKAPHRKLRMSRRAHRGGSVAEGSDLMYWISAMTSSSLAWPLYSGMMGA